MRKNAPYLVMGNWKMNPESRKEAKKLFRAVTKVSRRRKPSIVFCPPFPYLPLMAEERLPTRVFLGSQDCFWEKSGPHTGEVSPTQLKDLKVSYAIVGHSERRALGVTDEYVSRKVEAVIKAGLSPVICIGERERDSNGVYLEFLESQLRYALSSVSAAKLTSVVIAYEPIWAIGKSDANAITGHKLYEIEVFIRRFLTRKYGKKKAFSVYILYGGSVSPKNTREILTEGKVDGLLVGRRSRDPESFSAILDIVDDLSS